MTTSTTTTSTTATPSPAVSKRPLTLTIGAVLLVLAALLTLTSPFLRRGPGGFGGANRPAGTRTAGQAGGTGQGQTGQGQTGQGAGQGSDQGGFGQGAGQGQGTGQGGVGQGTGQGGFGGAGRAGAGANAALFRFITPIRITEGIIGGLFTLLAAWGIWKRQKWGMVLALIASVVMLLAGAFTVVVPLLGRTATRTFGVAMTFIAGGAAWEAILGMIIAVLVAVLVLLPVSQKGYIIKPKVRQVM